MSNARGSGSGSGATTTAHNTSNPSLRDATLDSGSGSGSNLSPASGRCNMGTTVEFGDTGYISTPEEVTCDPPTVQVPIIVGYPGTCPVSVNYTTQNGTAIAGTDYTAVNGTASIPAGSSGPYWVSIPILDDGTDESVGSEVFYVNLSSPQNATIGGDNPFRVYITEPTLQGSTDTLVWNPCQDGDGDDNYNASNPLNWYDQTLGRQLQKGEPGPGSGTPIIFDGTATTQTPDDDSQITWDDPQIPSWTLENAFARRETINPGDTIELTGDASGTSLSMDANSLLNLDFADSNSKFQIDKNATITNIVLAGNRDAQFIVNGGTTTIAENTSYQETVGVQVVINKNATLNDQSTCSLKLANNNLTISVYGTMKTFYGPNQGITLIDSNGYSNDYIYVNGGQLSYQGTNGVQDMFTIPVAVVNGGDFNISTIPGRSGAMLIVMDASGYVFPNGETESVFMDGGGSVVELSTAATLASWSGYFQDSGTLKTTDSTACTLSMSLLGQGTAEITGGVVWIDTLQNSYATLNLNGSVFFNGELNVSMDASNPGTSDLLKVSGTTTLQASSSLYVFVYNGPPTAPNQKWLIIQDTGGAAIQGNFSALSEQPNTNVIGSISGDTPAQYFLISGG